MPDAIKKRTKRPRTDSEQAFMQAALTFKAAPNNTNLEKVKLAGLALQADFLASFGVKVSGPNVIAPR